MLHLLSVLHHIWQSHICNPSEKLAAQIMTAILATAISAGCVVPLRLFCNTIRIDNCANRSNLAVVTEGIGWVEHACIIFVSTGIQMCVNLEARHNFIWLSFPNLVVQQSADVLQRNVLVWFATRRTIIDCILVCGVFVTVATWMATCWAVIRSPWFQWRGCLGQQHSCHFGPCIRVSNTWSTV